MKVVLMGYMGSGKSTIGEVLASTLNFNFIDLDDYIVKHENMTIPEIFDKKGEIYFRKKEYHYLKELLSDTNDFVLSLGGGTPCYGNNMKLILNSNNSLSFYLKASIGTLAKRLFNQKESRPLIKHLNTLDDLQEYLGKHLFERSFYYNQANNIVNVNDKTEKDIVEGIVCNLF